MKFLVVRLKDYREGQIRTTLGIVVIVLRLLYFLYLIEKRRTNLSRTLLISEKPTAAKRIAEALDDSGSPKEVKKRGASYFECRYKGKELYVVYALGHLFELKQTKKGWKYPRLSTEWVPKYEVDKKAKKTKPIIALIKKVSKEADRFVVATDFDIEGSLIGFNTLKYACGANVDDAQRMIFSTLTKTDIQKAYDNMEKGLDFPIIEAGQTRHEIDWLFGINLTRALTLAIKNVAGWFKIVSTGRVQGPALAFVAKRDQDINVFVPEPYWKIHAQGCHSDHQFDLEYQHKKIETLREAEGIVTDLKDSEGVVESIKSRKSKQSPPVPFNLSGLQSESYRHFGFKPSRTLYLAQKLYLDALISYPRTSSQKIPSSIDLRGILKGLEGRRKYSKPVKKILGASKLTPVQGKKTDPAHPAIHPTGNKPSRKLTPSENKLYDLIVKRFLSLFGKPATKQSLRGDIKFGKHTFYVRGLRILKMGWMEYYSPYVKHDEREIPPLEKGNIVRLVSIDHEDKFTNPPARFNHSSLLKLLEKEDLGTKATRAGIVDSLRSRGYTLNKQFELSTLGYALFETLGQYVPRLLSVEFTHWLQEEMDKIQRGESNRQHVLERANTELLELLQSFKEKEELIGTALVNGLQRYWKQKEEVGSCPKCGDGTLIIIKSPKSGKRFVGCSNYKEKGCDQTFPLPQKGSITPLDKTCPHCGHHMIKVVSGRRAWETCVNWADCPGRQDDIEALQKRREKQRTKKEDK